MAWIRGLLLLLGLALFGGLLTRIGLDSILDQMTSLSWGDSHS